MRQHIAWTSIFLNLFSMWWTQIWRCCPLNLPLPLKELTPFLQEANSVPYRGSWLPSFSRKQNLLGSLLPHVAFLLPPFAGGSHLDASWQSTYLHSTPWHSELGASMRPAYLYITLILWTQWFKASKYKALVQRYLRCVARTCAPGRL